MCRTGSPFLSPLWSTALSALEGWVPSAVTVPSALSKGDQSKEEASSRTVVGLFTLQIAGGLLF